MLRWLRTKSQEALVMAMFISTWLHHSCPASLQSSNATFLITSSHSHQLFLPWAFQTELGAHRDFWLFVKGGWGGGVCSCYQGAGECGCSSEGGGRCFYRRYMQTFFFPSGRNCDEILDFCVEWGFFLCLLRKLVIPPQKRIKQI